MRFTIKKIKFVSQICIIPNISPIIISRIAQPTFVSNYNEFLYVVCCAIWYHLYNLKNAKKTHGGVLILVKLQAVSLRVKRVKRCYRICRLRSFSRSTLIQTFSSVIFVIPEQAYSQLHLFASPTNLTAYRFFKNQDQICLFKYRAFFSSYDPHKSRKLVLPPVANSKLNTLVQTPFNYRISINNFLERSEVQQNL